MIDVKELPDDVQELKNIIIDLQNEKDNYEKKINALLEDIELWKKKAYGPKSEKYYADNDEQRFLFNEAEAGFDKESLTNNRQQTHVEVKAHTRIKKGRRKLPESLERIIKEIDIPESQKICASGKKRKFIKREISEKLDIKPPEVKVIQTKRAVYGCPDSCCVLCEEKGESPVKTAPVPPQLLEKTIVTPGLFSYFITSKYCDHLPYYRQEKIFSRYQIDLTRQSMCRWTIKIFQKYSILQELLWKELLSGPLIGIDETTMQVVLEDGRSAKTKSYLWVFRGGNARAPTIIVKYRRTRSAKFLLELLQDYKGYIQTDGYKGYNDLEVLAAIILIACWAHARRKFYEAAKASKNKGSAQEALSMIQQLYLIEKTIKDKDVKERKRIRQEEAVPILNTIKAWLDKKKLQVLPESLIGKAVNYTLKLWPKLIKYVDDGIIPIDNNGVENAIRPECLGKKNWLFAYTPSGADASAFFYSLIETAKANGLEPYWYLRYLFDKIIKAKNEEDFRMLLPQYVDHQEIMEYRLPGQWG
ncbi:MAG: IS66 family transposase [Sedimentisphaerales bacterium]